MNQYIYEAISYINPSFALNIYTNILPNVLLSSNLNNDGKLYDYLTNNQAAFISDSQNQIKIAKIVTCLIFMIVIAAVIYFRIRDNIDLIKYCNIIESITHPILSERLRELKYSLNQFHKLKNNKIENVEIDRDCIITIKKCKNNSQLAIE